MTKMEYLLRNYIVDQDLKSVLKHIQDIVNHLNARRDKGLSSILKEKLFHHLKISQVYNSNAIEGNVLSIRETELILDNMQLNDRPLKDQIEAKTLNNAIDFLYNLINGNEKLSRRSLLELHQILMTGVENINGGVFRKSNVQIKGSNHTPPDWITVDDHIDELFNWYNSESTIYPIIKATILHHWLTWIHPFEDGNGRMSRLMLNFHLMQFGFPEVVIRITDRDRYYESLTEADNANLSPLIELVSDKLLETVTVYEEFLNEEEREREWINKYSENESNQRIETLRFNYEVWKSALEVFKTRFQQSVSLVKDKIPNININFREYPILSFNQYLDILENRKVSSTWFFSVGIHNFIKNRKIAVVFYFERHFPVTKKKVFYTGTDGKKRYRLVNGKAGKPYIKLYASLREAGQSRPLPETFDFANVGMKGDKMVVGVRDKHKRNYIVSQETHLAAPIIRDFIDQLISTYVK
jgi:Fic family protein